MIGQTRSRRAALATALLALTGARRLQLAWSLAHAIVLAIAIARMPPAALVIATGIATAPLVSVTVIATVLGTTAPGAPGLGADTPCRLRPVGSHYAGTRPAWAAYFRLFLRTLACRVPTVAFGPVHSIAVALHGGLSYLVLREGRPARHGAQAPASCCGPMHNLSHCSSLTRSPCSLHWLRPPLALCSLSSSVFLSLVALFFSSSFSCGTT